jgi:hypothetical protein
VDVSLCDICTSPGRCCTDLALSGGDKVRGFLNDRDMTRERVEEVLIAHNLPFKPLREEQKSDGMVWRFTCPKLTPEGRCGDYENRPNLCRDYQPGEDGLCVYYVSPEEARAA